MSEHDYAVMESEMIASVDEYISARPQLDSVHNRRIYEAGFKAAYKKIEQQLSEANALIAMRKQRAEAAEQRIRESQEQEPVMWYEAQESARGEPIGDVINSMMYSTRIHICRPETSNPVWPLYAQPIIPPSLEELQRENAELTRKLAEQQSHNNFDAVRLRRLCTFCGVAAPESNEELLQVAGVVIGSCLRILEKSKP